MACVEIAVPIVGQQVKVVLWKRAAIGCHIVQSMRPCVGELRRETVPLANLQNGLQRVVIGVPVAFDFVDVAEVRELAEVGAAGLQRRLRRGSFGRRVSRIE